MGFTSELMHHLEKLETCKRPDQMKAVAKGFAQALDLQGFAYHAYGPDIGFHQIEDWPREWAERYDSQHYGDIDPTVRKVLQEARPFSWTEVYAGATPSPLEIQMFGEAREFGLKEGAEIPIHGPNAIVATFSIYSSGSGRHFQEIWTTHKTDIRFFAHYFHYAFLDWAAPAPQAPHLSSRERECLAWRARDKTLWEIGAILGISEHTVKTHLLSAARKLDVGSIHQALVLTLLTKQILPF